MHREAEFVISALTERDFPREGLPEVVLAGRSNVGKSSLLNSLAGKKGLARTSSTPGKTRCINFYRLDHSFFFVDLPGFGYAKVARAESRQWKKSIEQYFRDRPTIAVVVHLVDSRLGPTELDIELAEWLAHLDVPRIVVATKADKLSANQRVAQQRAISDAFGGPVIMSSAVTGTGIKEIWKWVADAVQTANPRTKSPRVKH